MLMNDPSRDYYKLYEIDFDRHAYDGKNWTYVNLPIEDIKEMAIASIKDSTMMYFSCDVGKFFDRNRGVLDVNYYDYGFADGHDFRYGQETAHPDIRQRFFPRHDIDGSRLGCQRPT